MRLSPSTSSLLETLDVFSGHRLARRDDLGILLEYGAKPGKAEMINELAFIAKFVSGVYGIMRRIGAGEDGYDNLQRLFSEQLEKAVHLTQALVEGAPEEVRQHFSSTYVTLTPDSLQSFLALLYDLSWYKNWRIDHPGDTHSGHGYERNNS